jgi:hypothetical protein
MSLRYKLTVLLSDGQQDLVMDVFDEVLQKLWERLGAVNAYPRPTRPASQPTEARRPLRTPVRHADVPRGTEEDSFVALRTVDGRCIVLNLLSVQGVRTSTYGFGASETAETYDGPTEILLKGRGQVLDTFPPDDASLGDLVMALEHGPDVVPWVNLVVDDGDELMIRAREVVYVIASSARLDAAYEGFIKDSGD